MANLEVQRVLVVDDDLDTCENLKQILELDGYEVDFAISAAETRTSRPWSDYFAIILDRNLPDGSADELLPEIKAKSPDTAVIIITGFPDLEASVKAIRHNAEDYFLKPLDLNVFRSSLAQIARAQRAERRAADAERLAIIGQMVAGIAHESRNAIQRIQTGVEMLRLDIKQPELLRELEKIESANFALQSTLDEIRDFAAPLTLKRSDVDISKVWKLAWSNVAQVSKKNGDATFREKTNGHDLICHVDEFRLEQVFRNIFENSLAACENAPEIEVVCEEFVGVPRSRGNEAFKISIRDNGPGFADEHVENIFEPFFTTKQKGTGLGMSIVKRTVEAHGGSIKIGEGRESGAEIIITVPRRHLGTEVA